MKYHLLRLICDDNLIITMLLSRIIRVNVEIFNASLNKPITLSYAISLYDRYNVRVIINYPRYSCVKKIITKKFGTQRDMLMT